MERLVPLHIVCKKNLASSHEDSVRYTIHRTRSRRRHGLCDANDKCKGAPAGAPCLADLFVNALCDWIFIVQEHVHGTRWDSQTMNTNNISYNIYSSDNNIGTMRSGWCRESVHPPPSITAQRHIETRGSSRLHQKFRRSRRWLCTRPAAGHPSCVCVWDAGARRTHRSCAMSRRALRVALRETWWRVGFFAARVLRKGGGFRLLATFTKRITHDHAKKKERRYHFWASRRAQLEKGVSSTNVALFYYVRLTTLLAPVMRFIQRHTSIYSCWFMLAHACAKWIYVVLWSRGHHCGVFVARNSCAGQHALMAMCS